jgi:O-antigen/teichoic acid export membrane protein
MRNDVIANYASQLVNIFLRFFLVPIYISHLGVSAYGIIGFYFSIESIMVILDFGIGVSSAKLVAEKLELEPTGTIKILKSVEVFYLMISLLIGVVLYSLSGFVSIYWLTIDDKNINGTTAISLMALLLTVGWPKSLYENLLIGQKKIIQKNIVSTSVNIIRSIVMVYFINVLNGKLEVYFWVMIISVFIETISYRLLAFKDLRYNHGFATFRELKPFVKFTSGVGVFSILSLVIFQADRIFISKFLKSSDMGLYNLSAVIPLAIFSLIYPITSAAFPRLVRIDENEKGNLVYNKWSLILGILSTSYFAIIITNLSYITNIWLHGESGKVNIIVANTLLIGVFCHSFTNLNINLFIANGRSNAVSTIYLISSIIYVFILFLIIGLNVNYVAFAWFFCNLMILGGTMFYLYKYFKKTFTIFFSNIAVLILILFIYLIIYYFGIVRIPFNDHMRFLLSGITLSILLFLFFRKKKSLFISAD